MPRYYLNVRNVEVSADDEEGTDFRDLDAARAKAIASVRSILSDEVMRGKVDLRGRIEITDARGEIVLTVPYAEAVTVRDSG
jgi:hypothetical protein